MSSDDEWETEADFVNEKTDAAMLDARRDASKLIHAHADALNAHRDGPRTADSFAPTDGLQPQLRAAAEGATTAIGVHQQAAAPPAAQCAATGPTPQPLPPQPPAAAADSAAADVPPRAPVAAQKPGATAAPLPAESLPQKLLPSQLEMLADAMPIAPLDARKDNLAKRNLEL